MEKIHSYHSAVISVIEIYDTTPSKADEILSEQIFISVNKRPYQAICQFIFLTVLRNKFLIEQTISTLAKKKPRKKLLYILKASIAEIIISDEKNHPKVIHSWVDFTKKVLSLNESKFVNAILRKSYEALSNIRNSDNLSIAYSMPLWIVERWKKHFGLEKTRELLQLCNKPSEVFFRKSYSKEAENFFKNYSNFFKKSDFENFYILKSGNWNNVSDLLKSRFFYIQDPSTSFAAKQLEPKCSGCYLDLCASPGGKSRIIADLIEKDFIENSKSKEDLSKSLLVSVDLPKRIKKLRENLESTNFIKSVVVECDLLNENLEEILKNNKLPTQYDGIFIDAPCSNTGVLRRRPDARYRISEKDIFECKKIQIQILEKHKGLVKSGGKIIFSTCSIDIEENEKNAEEFISKNNNFKIIKSGTCLPTNQSDGCGFAVFLKEK